MQISVISQTTGATMTFNQNKLNGDEAIPTFQQVQESQLAKEENKSNTIPASELPVQAYALPSWYDKYIPDAMFLTGTLNYEYFDFVAELNKDNYLSDDDRNQIKKYLQNDPMHQEMLAKQKFRAKFRNELSEYYGLLSNYFREALKENGIDGTSQADYYEKVILDKDNSEKIHQSMQKRIENDPRVLELMGILGIQSNT